MPVNQSIEMGHDLTKGGIIEDSAHDRGGLDFGDFQTE